MVQVRTSRGFTLVELLIVIVVIAILAAITVVAYGSVTNKANISSAQQDASSVAQKLKAYQTENNSLPSNLTAINVSDPSNGHYTYDNYGDTFCVAATIGSVSYQVEADSPVTYGDCTNVAAVAYLRTGGTTNTQDYFTHGNDVLAQATSAAPINYNWGGGSPVAGGPADDVVVEFTGYLTAPTTDTYTFSMVPDDKASLYLNGALVADGSPTGSSVTVSGTAAMTAGQRVPFRIEYAEHTGNAKVSLSWSYTGQSTVIVPASAISG